MFADAINQSAQANEAIQKKQDIAASRVARSNALFRVLDELPCEFSRADMQKAMEKTGHKATGTNEYINRLIAREMIMQTKEGYKKLIS